MSNDSSLEILFYMCCFQINVYTNQESPRSINLCSLMIDHFYPLTDNKIQAQKDEVTSFQSFYCPIYIGLEDSTMIPHSPAVFLSLLQAEFRTFPLLITTSSNGFSHVLLSCLRISEIETLLKTVVSS